MGRRKPKVPRVTRVLTAAKPHPSRGGNAYSLDFRVVCAAEYNAGAYAVGPGKPTMRTVARWVNDGPVKQSLRPFEKKGNDAAMVLHGEDRILVAVYRKVLPKVTAAEMMTFVYNHSSAPRLYTSGQISQCEIDLGLTRKVASTTANQALLPANLLRREQFWNMTFPIGVTDTMFEDLVDIDETGIELNVCNRNYGKASVNMRVNETGNYERTTKYTLILAVRPNGPPIWRFSKDRGTSSENFSLFLEEQVFPQLGQVRRRTLMWDNLRSHMTAQVSNVVHNSIHRMLPRPPYRPQDGPVEYANNQLLTMMREECYKISSCDELEAAMPRLVGQISNMSATFEMCGY